MSAALLIASAAEAAAHAEQKYGQYSAHVVSAIVITSAAEATAHTEQQDDPYHRIVISE